MTDQKLEEIIGNLLRAGVLLAAAVVFTGGVVALAQRQSYEVNYRAFKGEPETLRSVEGIWTSSIHGHSVAIIQLGLLLLIATPIARVLMAVVGFYVEKDYTYVVVSLIVFGVLMYSIMHAT